LQIVAPHSARDRKKQQTSDNKEKGGNRMAAHLQIPEGYATKLNLRETEIAIKFIKDHFERSLANALNLTRVSAPLFVRPESGLNDNLNGVERPVGFDMRHIDGNSAEIVQSLAKWKRMALGRYGFEAGEGLYTDMNAIRRDEEPDNLHSIYVDQWDWEMVITREQRTPDFLKGIVKKIYHVFLETQKQVLAAYPQLEETLPPDIHFLTAQELEDKYPGTSAKERETAFVKEHGSLCLMQIGGKLNSGKRHDGRAPDYDDWQLNCDILFYNKLLDCAFEVSSMGIRVDAEAMEKQLALAGEESRRHLPFHKAVLEDKLPLTLGGGLGQSRICMFLLGKAHVGEVQASIWPDAMDRTCRKHGIMLL
jgi:aspartate--ammonia ligase